MKLTFIEVAGFRGFRDKARFDLPSGFAVLTGRNGAGKSTVLDAVDFVLTGTINKYSVRGAKGGGLQDHIWWLGEGAPENQYVALGLTDHGGEQIVITRSRYGGLDRAESDIARQLCTSRLQGDAWLDTLMQTTLIRDETIAALSLDLPEQARFAAVRAAVGGLAGHDYSSRMAALSRAAASAKVEQDKRAADVKADLGRALSGLTEARSNLERHADVAEAQQIIERILPDLVSAAGNRTARLRTWLVDRKRSNALLEAAVLEAERLRDEQRRTDSDLARAELAAARADRDAAFDLNRQAEASVSQARHEAARERQRDSYASHLLALLDHGEAIGLRSGHCPLCDAERESAQFSAAIADARARISEGRSRLVRANAALERAQMGAVQAAAILSEAEERLSGLEERRLAVARGLEALAVTFGQLAIQVSPTEPAAARRLLLQRQEEAARLEQALYVLEASSTHDRLEAMELRIQQLREQVDSENAKLIAGERAAACARQLENAAKEVANQVLMEQFDTVMPLLKELYQRLRPHTDWDEIEADFGGRVRGSLNLMVGDGRNPQFLFSSGQRRAAGLAFLLAIHLSRPWCQLRSLLLDDPIQHIDDYRALNLVEVLSAVRRTGRQVIVAVEDIALADVLCRRLRSTTLETGRRFELSIANNGSAVIDRQIDIFPLINDTLKTG